ncbi:MAG: nucleotidyltransferase domain-containing protein [Candidatus Thorarchaeota archaeon]
MKIDSIRHDLKYLSNKEVILFGSYVTSNYGPRSDIDVCLITRLTDRAEMMKIRIEASGKAPEEYDIQVLESLPIIIIGQLLENYQVLFGNPLEIGMYLYKYRKLWNDYQFRLDLPTIQEIKRNWV